VEKVAVRYINKISIREGSEIFDSIYTYPKLAAGLPDTMTGLFVRLQISIPEPPGVLVVTEAGLPEEKPGFAEIALGNLCAGL
jgi:hypothetical protein